MGGSLKRGAGNEKHSDELSHERYRNALEIERSNHANELAKRAEKLRLIYKTRFEEDLRAFMVSHKVHDRCLNSHIFKFNNSKPSKTGNICAQKCRMASKYTQNNSEVQKSSFIPTWAWPASLRNSEDVKPIALFYTAETNVPISPSQVGGKHNKKLTQICDYTKTYSKNNTSLLKNFKISKEKGQEKLNNQPIVDTNNYKQNQRQKLRSKYGAPFTWIQNNSRNNAESIPSPLESPSDISTPRVFTEIPKQPSIYPLELERNINTNSNSDISEFIKKSLRMQKALEFLIGHNPENTIRKINAINTSIYSEVK
ncbi:uncharacterized protein cubi_03528 [Cryptosporidium ubiquitum]|uniref:Uncharacterized protein n=1 Tax=Cryptosporidium ubiquitum TaxID=857276 RepID=A0A1J4MHI8_9CRYT|nr:uncharacterized protein cubi_03528 [Cryptosporidium ubiquitum]OII73730.1 hypothetical protein cubi_03528 [Cryptosporidium ubiquitum]